MCFGFSGLTFSVSVLHLQVMDSRKGIASGVAVIVPGAPSSYQLASRMENSELEAPQMASPMMGGNRGTFEKKKRGRPRKYKPDGSPNVAPSADRAKEAKLQVARTISSGKRFKSKIGTEKLDGWVECSTGSSFWPHAITVNVGEDVSAKIMEFSREGPRSVCIMSGSGTVSNVTLRHPNSSGGILTYEGLFEILSISGSYMPVETLDPKFGRCGTMTITLSGADGRVVGGLIAGLTVAATPVKLYVASFLPSSPFDVVTKKQFTIEALDPVEKKTTNNNNTQGPSCSNYDGLTSWAVMHSA